MLVSAAQPGTTFHVVRRSLNVASSACHATHETDRSNSMFVFNKNFSSHKLMNNLSRKRMKMRELLSICDFSRA